MASTVWWRAGTLSAILRQSAKAAWGGGPFPTIHRRSRLLIRMNYDDHNPPHFHVIYGEYQAVIGIQDFAILEGDLPPRALGLVTEWARIHQDELLEEWSLARQARPLRQLPRWSRRAHVLRCDIR